MTEVYDPKAFVPHAALLRQACAHCGRFSTAASRRSLGSVSVPVWVTILSDHLPVVALVGRYPANKHNGARAHPRTMNISAENHAEISRHPVLDQVSLAYSGFGGRLLTCYSPLRHWSPRGPVRLACLIHAASVHSEPGSNSPLQKV